MMTLLIPLPSRSPGAMFAMLVASFVVVLGWRKIEGRKTLSSRADLPSLPTFYSACFQSQFTLLEETRDLSFKDRIID